MQGTRLALVVGAGDENLVLLDLGLDRRGHAGSELALRALDCNLVPVDRHGDAGGDVDGKTSNTRHLDHHT